MKNISQFSKDISDFEKRLKEKLIKAQKETAEQMKNHVIEKAGFRSGKYIESIQTGETECNDEKIKTEIYTDFKSKDGYFIGRMIENGTGIYALEPHIGHTKTFKESGYQYWYVPTNEVDRPIGEVILINGVEFYIAKAQKPKPHWRPVLEEDMELYKSNISKAIKEALCER